MGGEEEKEERRGGGEEGRRRGGEEKKEIDNTWVHCWLYHSSIHHIMPLHFSGVLGSGNDSCSAGCRGHSESSER